MIERPTERKRIIPALAALQRSAEESLFRLPLGDCLPGGAARLAPLIDELSEIGGRLQLSPLSADEQARFTGEGYAGQDVLAQSIEAPLGRCPDVQEGAGCKPEEGRSLREMLDEMVRAYGAAQAILAGAQHGRRLVGGILAYACLRLVSQIEGGLRAGEEELLGETAALRERIRRYLAGREALRDREQRRLLGLEADAQEAEAALHADRTMEAIARGERPADEDVLLAAERAGAPKDERRRPR